MHVIDRIMLILMFLFNHKKVACVRSSVRSCRFVDLWKKSSSPTVRSWLTQRDRQSTTPDWFIKSVQAKPINAKKFHQKNHPKLRQSNNSSKSSHLVRKPSTADYIGRFFKPNIIEVNKGEPVRLSSSIIKFLSSIGTKMLKSAKNLGIYSVLHVAQRLNLLPINKLKYEHFTNIFRCLTIYNF